MVYTFLYFRFSIGIRVTNFLEHRTRNHKAISIDYLSYLHWRTFLIDFLPHFLLAIHWKSDYSNELKYLYCCTCTVLFGDTQRIYNGQLPRLLTGPDRDVFEACSSVKLFERSLGIPSVIFSGDVCPLLNGHVFFFSPKKTTSNGVSSSLIRFQGTINPEKLRAFMGEQCPGWLVLALELEPEFCIVQPDQQRNSCTAVAFFWLASNRHSFFYFFLSFFLFFHSFFSSSFLASLQLPPHSSYASVVS